MAQDSFEDPGRVARVLEAARYDFIGSFPKANQPRSPERTDMRYGSVEWTYAEPFAQTLVGQAAFRA